MMMRLGVFLGSIILASSFLPEKALGEEEGNEGPQIGHSMNVRVQAQWPTLDKGYGLVAEAR
jgi:hypothetical protein